MAISGMTLKAWTDPYDRSEDTEGPDLTSNLELITIDEWWGNTQEEPYPQHPLPVTACKTNIQIQNPQWSATSDSEESTPVETPSSKPMNHITMYNLPLRKSNGTWASNSEVLQTITEILGKDWDAQTKTKCYCIYPSKPRQLRGRVHMIFTNSKQAHHFWSLLYKFEKLAVSFKWGIHTTYSNINPRPITKLDAYKLTNKSRETLVPEQRDGPSAASIRMITAENPSYDLHRYRAETPIIYNSSPSKTKSDGRRKEMYTNFATFPNNIPVNKPRDFRSKRKNQRNQVKMLSRPRHLSKGIISPRNDRIYHLHKEKTHPACSIGTISDSTSEWHMGNRYAPLVPYPQNWLLEGKKQKHLRNPSPWNIAWGKNKQKVQLHKDTIVPNATTTTYPGKSWKISL